MDNNMPWHPVKGCNVCEESCTELSEQSNPIESSEGRQAQENFLVEDGVCHFHKLLWSVSMLQRAISTTTYGLICSEVDLIDLEKELSCYGDYSSDSRNEQRSREFLVESGYPIVTKGYLSPVGVKLLIAISKAEVRLCLITTPSEGPKNDELDAFKNFDCSPHCRKEVHRWRHDQKQPDIEQIGLGTGNRSSFNVEEGQPRQEKSIESEGETRSEPLCSLKK